MQVHDKRVYTRILRNGSLGFGESYMDGQWDRDALDDLTVKLVRAEIDKKVPQGFPDWSIGAGGGRRTPTITSRCDPGRPKVTAARIYPTIRTECRTSAPSFSRI